MRVFATASAWLVLANPAFGSDWQHQYISDHLEGRIGLGAYVDGFLDGNRGKQPAQLRAYCAKNSTVLNLESDKMYFGSSAASVRYKLDDGPAQSAQWDVCSDGRCVGLWHGRGIPFLKSLFGKKELRIVVELRFAGPLHGTFRVGNAEYALAEMGEKCGWLPNPPAKKTTP